MLHNIVKTLIYVAGLFIFTSAACADVMPHDWRHKLSDQAWEENLRYATFQDREIIEDADAPATLNACVSSPNPIVSALS